MYYKWYWLSSNFDSWQSQSNQNIALPQFRHVSIITCRNSQRDEINRLGAIRFAQETGQELLHFYSEDSACETREEIKKRARVGLRKTKVLTKELQEILWSLPSSASKSLVLGILSLCIGMPVTIRANIVTELNITKGQAARVKWATIECCTSCDADS